MKLRDSFDVGSKWSSITGTLPTSCTSTMAALEGMVTATVVSGGDTGSALRYVSVSAGENQTYLVRSDGACDRSTGGGKVSHQINPPPGCKFIAASSGAHGSYFVRDDGVVSRTTGGGTISVEISPPEKTKYVAVSAGESQSYLLRDDGVVDRTKGKGLIQKSVEPPEGCTYTAVSVGNTATYLLRSDGAVDRIAETGLFDRPKGKEVTQTMRCSEEKVRYTQVSGGLYSSYLLRDDGKIDRTTGNGVVKDTIEPPAGVTYRGLSSLLAVTETDKRPGPHTWYFLRSDGACDRVTSDSSSVASTMNPPPGLTYEQASSSLGASYLLQSDGKVARTTGRGTVNLDQMMDAANPNVGGGGCSIS